MKGPGLGSRICVGMVVLIKTNPYPFNSGLPLAFPVSVAFLSPFVHDLVLNVEFQFRMFNSLLLSLLADTQSSRCPPLLPNIRLAFS